MLSGKRTSVGDTLIVEATCDKFIEHQPLERQGVRFARDGIEIAPQTLGRSVGAHIDLLQPVADLIAEQTRAPGYLGTDATGIPVLDPSVTEGIRNRVPANRVPEKAEKRQPSARKVPTKVGAQPAKAKPESNASAGRPTVAAVLRNLEQNASKPLRAQMATRYGIVTNDRVFGTPMAKIKELGRRLGRDHALALALWKTGIYEARMLASMVDDPGQVSSSQMDRWAKDFDNWAVADTLCFNLFDRTPHAFAKIASWSKSDHEFVRRGAFALLASAALHGQGTDDDILRGLPLIEQVSTDPRNFVKKGASWALRAIGAKKSLAFRTAARALARRLAESEDSTARWIGKDALREFRRKD